ncbi:hypothetical protein HW932_01520 [Allochromatium humboldtianum]|uniref:Uncharacterized protein n=1 Tax=Allochromatium humboldtianum TaxID=504901 RepID=A0A850RAG2_9GAMM|nr:hypothetical protein [Allochromatium humboldtianum]NVZ07940.1 hypothetical protein [Allochromatium humboldtianum]
MPMITCSNEECGAEIKFDLSQLEIEDSQPSGNHTTQYSASGEVLCNKCNTETEVNCVWDELNDTGEILSLDFT